VLKTLHRLPEAELACRRAGTIRTNYPEAPNNLGSVLGDLKRPAEAETAYRQALAQRPDYAEAHYNLGIVLHKLERLAEAEMAYREALVINPAGVEAHNNLGGVLQALDRLPEAAAAYQQALALRPELIEAHYNLGNVFKELGRLAEAEASYRRAISIRADYADASFALATLLISLGQFEEGFRLYEYRYRKQDFIYHKTPGLLPCPQWHGDALAGKSLLLWQEDGIGDIVQFARYLPLIKAQGAVHVTVACLPALQRLLAALDGVDAVLDHESALAKAAEFDYWTSLLSAPLHFRTTLETIPPVTRLELAAPLVEHWRARLAALPAGRRIGLVWKGNPRHQNDANRSLPSLTVLAPLWSVPDVCFVSLQKGQGEDEGRSPPACQPLLHLGSEVTDIADSAAIIAGLDLVICVDTSIAHLAASLGKPCWVMLPGQGLDWRWMHERTDSPWYPQTLRLFRRGTEEGWPAVIERVRAACLEELPVALASDN
jgi:tetratricopeptide (TPR) repeat protein